MRIIQLSINILGIIFIIYNLSCENNQSLIKPQEEESTIVIDDSIQGTASIHICDLNNDGNLEIVGAVFEENSIVYWQNEGEISKNWQRKIIDDNFSHAISVYTIDIDGDNDIDVIGGAARKNEVALWYNDGGNPINWRKQIIKSGFWFTHEVYANDLDLDGDMDVLAASTGLNSISWWRNDGGNPIFWVEQTIDSSFIAAKSIRTADFDEDGDIDIVGAALDGNEVALWLNNGSTPPDWTKFSIDNNFLGAHRVEAIDMDNDNDIDVLAAAYYGNSIAWWENTKNNQSNWIKHIIGENFQNACIAQGVDLDKDNDIDVVGTAQEGDEVACWYNNGNSLSWNKKTLFYLTRVWPLYACDMDFDNDIDIVVASGWKGVNELILWENKTIQ